MKNNTPYSKPLKCLNCHSNMVDNSDFRDLKPVYEKVAKDLKIDLSIPDNVELITTVIKERVAMN